MRARHDTDRVDTGSNVSMRVTFPQRTTPWTGPQPGFAAASIHPHHPQFAGLPVHPEHRHPKLSLLGRLILSTTLAIGGMSALTGRNYISHERTTAAASQFWIDNFERTGSGVGITYYEPNTPYNNTNKPPPSQADYHRISPTPAMKAQTQLLGNRILELLSGRPDLVHALGSLPHGLNIEIYDAARIGRVPLGPDSTPGDLIGEVSSSGNTQQLTLRLTLGELGNLFPVDHEFGGHVLDSLNLDDGHVYVADTDGMLPGLSPSDQALYRKSRTQIQKDIHAGHSALRDYALTDNEEFLAVAVETFFQNPQGLKTESPGMYDVLHRFFNVNPATLPNTPKPGSLPKYHASPLPSAVTSVLVIGGSFLLIFGGHALWVRLSAPTCESGDCKKRRKPCRQKKTGKAA